MVFRAAYGGYSRVAVDAEQLDRQWEAWANAMLMGIMLNFSAELDMACKPDPDDVASGAVQSELKRESMSMPATSNGASMREMNWPQTVPEWPWSCSSIGPGREECWKWSPSRPDETLCWRGSLHDARLEMKFNSSAPRKASPTLFAGAHLDPPGRCRC